MHTILFTIWHQCPYLFYAAKGNVVFCICMLYFSMEAEILELNWFNLFLQFHNLQELRHSASLVTKVFIQRDYSDGTVCRFLTKFPSELDNRVSTQNNTLFWKHTFFLWARAASLPGLPCVCFPASRSSELCWRRQWRRWTPTMWRPRRSEVSLTWKDVWPVRRRTSSSSAWRLAMRR